MGVIGQRLDSARRVAAESAAHEFEDARGTLRLLRAEQEVERLRAQHATAAEDERKRIVEYLRGVSNQFANGDAVAQCDFTADAYGMAADDIEKMHHRALAEIEETL